MKPGGAEAALKTTLGDELLLDRMEMAGFRDSLDGNDLSSFRLGGQGAATGNGSSVEDDGAGAAISRATALLGAREVRDLADNVE